MRNPYFTVAIAVFSILIASCNSDDEPLVTPLEVGDFYQGGVIFYLDSTGEHGLICSITDQSFAAEWGCPALSINGADAEELGSGEQNTIDILDQCSQTGIAADLAASYENDGFSDWYLPSKDELSLIEANQEIINETAQANGGNVLEGTEYWSSTEMSQNTVWVEHLLDGDPFGVLKDSMPRNVRAIRSF